MGTWKFAKTKEGTWWLVIEGVEQLIQYKQQTNGKFGDYVCDIHNRIPESQCFNDLAIMLAEKDGLSCRRNVLHQHASH